MKQLLILSGKGGTGKTTVASAFIKLSNAKAYADCDVDAPNLHLINMQGTSPKVSDYFGLPKANINHEICIKCGKCLENCRFNAISFDGKYNVDLFACEGCGVCENICVSGAISLKSAVAGEIMLYKNEEKVFSTAKLKMGSGTSGKLVTEVKNQLKSESCNAEIAIIDGSPGIGCPVIASISGAFMVLIVAEPTISGIHDMERIVKTAKKFGTKIAVCVNKFDTNLENSTKIEEFCGENNLDFMGKIPFDENAVKAINSGKSIVDIDCKSGEAVRKVYSKVIEQFN